MHHTESLAPAEKQPLIEDTGEKVPENLPREPGVFERDGVLYCVYLQAQVVGEGVLHVVKFEALLRHMLDGSTPHDLFDQVFENGTAHELTRQVLRAVMEGFKQGIRLPISCNIYAHELTDEFVTHIEVLRDELSDCGIDPNLLGFEVLEKEDIQDEHIPILHKLHTLGAHLSMDDYGTGHADISTLRKILEAGVQVTVKLDRSLTLGGTVLQVMRDLKNEFGESLSIVAEGAQRTWEVEALLERGGVSIQSHATGGEASPLSHWIPPEVDRSKDTSLFPKKR